MQVGVYFESWAMPWSETQANDLTNLQKEITTVYLAFASPDLKYKKGEKSFQNTGLSFSSPFAVVKSSIILLQMRGVKVFLAVGGGSYWSEPKTVNHQAVVDLCDDLNCDGIDIDWEVGLSDESSPADVIKKLNGLTPKLISFTCFSTGAFMPSSNDKFSGMNFKALKECSNIIDQINVMAYDAGATFDSVAAFRAYRSLYPGIINIGFEIGKQGWGDALLFKPELLRVSQQVAKDKLSGCFFWVYTYVANAPRPTTPNHTKPQLLVKMQYPQLLKSSNLNHLQNLYTPRPLQSLLNALLAKPVSLILGLYPNNV